MARQVFRADLSKWIIRNLKFLLIYAALTILFWLIYNSGYDLYFLLSAVMLAGVGVVTFIVGILKRPKLVITDEGAKLGRVKFDFADVIDVSHKKGEYVFFLASRRRVAVKLAEFSENDLKEIDRIFAQRCLTYLSDSSAKEKIAEAAATDGLEFSFTAKRTAFFFAVYILVLVFGGLTLLGCVYGMLTNPVGEATGKIGLIFIITLAIVFLVYRIEKKAVKDVFQFRDDTFTLYRKGKVKFTFPRGDVRGVGINPNDQPAIMFRLDNNKKIHVQLAPYSRRDARLMKDKIRSIFFLPEKN